jgi:hypothetical protein
MGSSAAGRLPEVPLGALGVVGSVDVAQALERRLERFERLEREHRDLNVDDRLGGKPGHRRGADVVDPEGNVTQCVAQRAAQLLEAPRPRRVVRADFDGAARLAPRVIHGA